MMMIMLLLLLLKVVVLVFSSKLQYFPLRLTVLLRSAAAFYLSSIFCAAIHWLGIHSKYSISASICECLCCCCIKYVCVYMNIIVLHACTIVSQAFFPAYRFIVPFCDLCQYVKDKKTEIQIHGIYKYKWVYLGQCYDVDAIILWLFFAVVFVVVAYILVHENFPHLLFHYMPDGINCILLSKFVRGLMTEKKIGQKILATTHTLCVHASN